MQTPALFVLAAVVVALGCDPRTDIHHPTTSQGDAGSVALDLQLDTHAPVAGVPDRDRDPAVLAIDVAGEWLCTGALLASNLVLTARRCVTTADWNACTSPHDRDPTTFTIDDGDDPAAQKVLAKGIELLVPDSSDLCASDIALVVLDRDIADTTPLAVRDSVAEKGERIRTVSFGKRQPSDPAGKLLREHVSVTDVSATQFQVAEAVCQGDPGGLALDEGTGEIIGVATRASAGCTEPDVRDVYTRADAFASFIADALARAKQRRQDWLDQMDAGRPKPRTPKDAKPPSDLGLACQQGTECATGLCLRESARTYCSRACGGGDRCPTGYHCKDVSGTTACVMTL